MDCTLPIEILVEIACTSIESLRSMLALPPVARFIAANRKYVLNKLTIVTNARDCIKYYVGGMLHREDLPAIEYANGTKKWYRWGKCHRDGGLPAIECLNGNKEWYQGGKWHRDGDLPAVENTNGYKAWYKEGVLHRSAGPDGRLKYAVILPPNSIRCGEYWVNGERLY